MRQLTSMYSSEGQLYDLPGDKVEAFRQKRGGEDAVGYRLPDGREYSIPKSKVERFAEVHPDAQPTRRMAFANGTTRDFTLPELSKFLRSKEWREGEEYKQDRAESDQKSAAWAGLKGGAWEMYGQLGGDASSIRDTAEATKNPLYKGYAYAQDLANSFVGGLLGGFAKINEGVGHLAGNNAVGRYFVNAGRSDQEMLRRTLPTDALDTSGPGAANKVLGIGKNVAGVAGEFLPAAIPYVGQAYAASVASAGSVNRSAQIFEAANENGMSPLEANALALAGGAVDAIMNMMLMGKFKGIWKGEAKAAADATKVQLVRRLLTDTAKTGATMGAGGMLGDVANQVAGIDENGKVVAPKPYDVNRTLKAGFDNFIEGGMFHLVNTGAHSLPKAVKWVSEAPQRAEARQMEIQSARDALDTPEGRALVWSNSPDAAARIFEARRKGENVSRRMLKDLGIPEGVAPTAADRNALGDTLLRDYDAYEKSLREQAAKPAETTTTPPKETTNETGTVPNEAPPRPEPPAATRTEGAEATSPVEGEAPRAEPPKAGVVEPKPEEAASKPPQKPPEASEPPKTDKDTPATSEGVEPPSRASDAKDYGVTMFEEPAVDGNGVKYVVKDGPSESHRMMFDSKEKAEARLNEIRELRKRITESPTAKLSDGTTVHLLKTDEGWVPFDEHYNDMRHGLYNAAKTKAQAVKVAEKGKAWAKGVAEDNKPAPKPDGKGKMVKPAPTEPPTSSAPTVDETGKAAEKPVPDGKGKMKKPGKKPETSKANPKNAEKVVDDFVSKDSTRVTFQRKHHDKKNGVVVATDGRVLIATKHGFDPNAEDHPEDPYPRWQQVVPKYNGKTVKVTERVEEDGKTVTREVELPVQSVKADPSAIVQACKTAIRLRNTIQPGSKDRRQRAEVLLPLPDGQAALMDAEYLLKVAKAMEANGITEIRALDGKHPILAKNADTTIVAMPIRNDGEGFRVEDFKSGRGRDNILFNALTGRAISGPERSDTGMRSRAFADELRKGIERGRKETADRMRKTNLYESIVKAWKRGETDVQKIYDSITGEGPKWSDLKPELRKRFEDFVKIGDADALAQKLAEYEAELRPDFYRWWKKDPQELEKIEKRIAAEDELDSLMGEAPAEPPAAPSKGKAKKPASDIQPQKPLGAPEPKGELKPPTSKEALRDSIAAAVKTGGSKGKRVVKAHDPVPLSSLPQKLHDVGMPDGTIYTRVHNLRKMKSKHGLEVDDIVGLVDDCANPVAVMRDKDGNGYIVLTDRLADDGNGRKAPVMVYMRPDGKGNYLISAYSRAEKSEVQYTNLINGGKLLFVDKERVATLPLRGEVLSSFVSFSDGDLSRGIVPNSAAPVKGGKPKTFGDTDSQPSVPQNAARNPRALKDPAFLDWAKKHARTPTPFARREYDRQKIEAAVPLYQRIFPGMKIKIHDKVEDPAKWTKDHPDGTLKMIRAKSGEVLGWYTPGFKELHLNPGATVETVAHEMLHAAQDWAKANSPELARALDNIARDCPEKLKKRILRAYGEVSPEAIMKEWGAFNFMGGEWGGKVGGKGKGGKAILDELARRENMTWAGKFWTAVKDIWKGMAAKFGGNRIDLTAIDTKTPQEAMDYLARAFAEGKTLGKMPKVGKTPRPAIDMTRKLSAKEKWEVNLHDYRNPLKTLRDEMAERGAKFGDDTDFYEAAWLQKGRDQAAVNDANRRMEAYRKMCEEKGVTHDEVVEFMQAQAAKDRNAMILKRNGKLDGSALTDAEAARTLKAFEDAGKGDALREISDYLLDMQAEGLDYRVKTGLLSAETVADWRAREPKHVPFRSAIDPETGDYIEWGNDHGSFAKAEFQTAEGRKTLAGDVVSWMFDEFIDAHTRGNENTVRKMIADAMRLHPEMGVGKILKGARKTSAYDFQGVVSKVVNGGNKGLLGKAAQTAIVNDPNYRESRRNGDGGRRNVLAFKEGGNALFIEFAPGERGQRIQAAVNGRDLKAMGKLWNKGMRFWSSTATELSPTFAFRNVIADNIDVFGNYVGEYGVIKGHTAYAKHVKNAAQLTPALIKYIATGKLPQGDMGEWIRRYEKAGGQIAGFANEGYNDIVKKIDLAPKHGIEKGKAIVGAVKDAVLSPVRGINAFAELSTRIAAFKTQCELGMTDHKAALWSRESTVDFNMKGNLTGITNGLWMFSNSTLGASARQLKSLFKSKHGWEVAGTFLAYGFAEGALEVMMNGDESDREKRGEGTGKDVTEYTRANSVYVRKGDEIRRVPFHAGPFSFLKYIGNCAARSAFGKMKPEDAAKEIGKEAVSQIFHYAGMGSVNFQSQSGTFADDAATLAGTAVPSLLQPVVQLALNIDHAGRTIHNEGFPGSTVPRSEQGRQSTQNWAVGMAKLLNKATGGNDARSGYIDLYPETIKMAGEAVGKNLLRDIMNAGTAIRMALGDEKVDVRNIPVARDFVRPVSGNDRRFNDAVREYKADKYDFDKHFEGMSEEEAVKYVDKHPWVADEYVKDAIAHIQKLRKMEQGFTYRTGKATPYEWTEKEVEEFKKERRQLQAEVLEKMGR